MAHFSTTAEEKNENLKKVTFYIEFDKHEPTKEVSDMFKVNSVSDPFIVFFLSTLNK